jgi:hypothetical protein
LFVSSVDLRANLTFAAENATGERTKSRQIPQNIDNQGQNVQKTSGFSRKLGRNTQPPDRFIQYLCCISRALCHATVTSRSFLAPALLAPGKIF